MKICVLGCGLRTPLLLHGLLHSDLAENSILGVHYRPPITAAAGFMNNAAINGRVKEIIENLRAADRQ